MNYLALFLVVTGCSIGKKLTVENYCCENVYTNMKEGIQIADSLDRLLFVTVFNDGDTSDYHNSTPALLNLSVKQNKAALKVLNMDYVIIKLYQSEFEKFLASLDHYEHADDYKKVAEMNTSHSYVFISSSEVLSIYDPIQLNEKDRIVDLIHVRMGP